VFSRLGRFGLASGAHAAGSFDVGRAVRGAAEGALRLGVGRTRRRPKRHAVVGARAAALLSGKPKDVALVESTTQGLQIAAEAIRTHEGDNVVVYALDYLAVGLPWSMSARERKIEVRVVVSKGAAAPSVDDFLERIDERTRAVAVSTIGWTTGALFDVEGLAAECAARGVLLVLDAIQTFGVVPLDVTRVQASFVACGGHKWLCSPLGAGFLYVSPLAAARARPRRFGFLSGRPTTQRDWVSWFREGACGVDDEVVFDTGGAPFETGGHPSWPGAIGLDRGLSLIEAATPGAILEHVRALGTTLIEGCDRLGIEVLTPRDPSARAGMIVLRAKGGIAEEHAWCDALRSRGVSVTARHAKGIGGVRVCLHGMNLEADVSRLLAELAKLK
jgi:cysteine desulfurase / selenocysteine lyase